MMSLSNWNSSVMTKAPVAQETKVIQKHTL